MLFRSGESVAVVIASTRREAEDGASLVNVSYEALPAVNDVRKGLQPNAPTVHAGTPNNLVAETPFVVGDVNTAFAKAKQVIKASFDTHRGGGFSMETRGCIAIPDTDLGNHTMYCTAQSPHRIKRVLMEIGRAHV